MVVVVAVAAVVDAHQELQAVKVDVAPVVQDQVAQDQAVLDLAVLDLDLVVQVVDQVAGLLVVAAAEVVVDGEAAAVVLAASTTARLSSLMARSTSRPATARHMC